MKKILSLTAVLLFGTVAVANAWFAADPKATNGAANIKIPVYNNASSELAAGNVVAWDIDGSTGDNDLYVALEDANDTGIVAGVVWPAAIAANSSGTIVVYGFAECDVDSGGVAENGLLCTSNEGSGGEGKGCAATDGSGAYAVAPALIAGNSQGTCFVTVR